VLFRAWACALDANATEFLQAQANVASGVHSEDSPTCSNGKRIFSHFVFAIVLHGML
jgi:hypothetical protein